MTIEDLVILLGDINLDAILRVAEYPPLGEDSLVEEASIGPGGGAANAACVLARLGMRPRLLARAGTDPLGELALQALQATGVDISAVERDPERQTGLIVVPVVPGGERTMFSYRGANLGLRLPDLSAETFRGVKALYLTGYAVLAPSHREAAWRAIELARGAGVPVAFDLNLEAARQRPEEMRRLAGMLEICTMGAADGEALYGTRDPAGIAHRQLSLGTRLVAVKDGARGAFLAGAATGEVAAIPAFHVASVDATGAGDAFSAGVLFGHLQGLDVETTGVIAAALGALATTVWGGGPGLPGKDEATALLEKWIANSPANELEPAVRKALMILQSTSK